jgi:hypothetical protein
MSTGYVNKSKRTEGAVLIGRRDSEFWFIDSVFKHGDDLSGVSGTICHPVSEEYAEELLSQDNLEERFGDCWNDQFENAVQDDCLRCEGYPNEEGCEDCNYPSVSAWCAQIGQYDGIDAVIDYAGDEYTEALVAIGEDAEYADTSGCGRIFGSADLTGWDEIYNRKALVAALAYEDGAVSYDYAVRVIFGK